MDKVFVTRRIPQAGVDILEKYFKVEVNGEERNLSKDEIIENIKDTFGIVTMVSDKIDKEVMDSAENLKIIANYGVGINNVDIDYATRKKILFTNTPGVLTQATAELAWGLIMAVARNIVQADKFTRSGEFTGFSPTLMLGKEFYSSTIGIIGMGRIGSSIARMARYGFNMNVLYYNRSKSEKELVVDAKRVQLDELLSVSDIVVVSAPLNSESKHLINKEKFELMKNDALFINVARGEVVDTDDLIYALENNIIGGAGLDVYENEPDFDTRLAGFKNCTLLPHIGSATVETREKMSKIVANNIVSVYKGRCPDYTVNGGDLCPAKN